MNKLISNELHKIFHKKAIWIIWGLMFALCLFNNYLYKTKYNEDGTYKDNNIIDNSYYKSSLEEELEGYDPTKASDVDMYVSTKTEYDFLVLGEKYDYRTWQYNIIQRKFHDIINNVNYYTYQEKDSAKLKECTDKYNTYISYLDNNDWKSFATEDKTTLEKSISDENKLLVKETNKQTINEINTSISNLEKQLDIVNYRLNKNIDYSNNFLNDAINNYSDSLNSITEYEEIDKPNYSQKTDYYKALSNNSISKYIIESGQNLNQENTLRNGIKSIFSDYELFIILIVLIIAGTIVSEEYNKGTIKMLLIKPYKRTTILLSKYLTTIIVLLLTILFALISEISVGGICFSFDSLSIPVMVFDYHTMSLISYNVFSYLGITLLASLPKVILLLTLAFAMGTIFGNSVVATSFPLLGFMFADLINQLAKAYNLTWMRYFVTPNWNFNEYLFGGLPSFENVNLTFSIIVCLIYFVIMMFVSLLAFKKKNIKNQ